MLQELKRRHDGITEISFRIMCKTADHDQLAPFQRIDVFEKVFGKDLCQIGFDWKFQQYSQLDNFGRVFVGLGRTGVANVF